ncbi:MAG TPA: prolipoprotein diacylglyceryl transferase [Cytophagaceae bacterium]|jgi:prolipoprotein diacylglyceryltransferase|nr:prolipoprotein diacylglyceryl transferase [Cytophagaceae bacterium]
MLDFIIWDFSPELFSIGKLTPRWYGPLFALGFIVGPIILGKIFKIEGRSQKEADTINAYMIIGTVLGARLGHCFFYEPGYFLAHPIEILYIWQGGLASHGAGIGMLTAIWLYHRKNPSQSYLYLLDRIVLTVALGGCFIRLGNLTNSEIIGIPANVPQGFVFVNSTTSAIRETFKGQVSDVSIKQNGTDSTMDGKYLTGVDIHMKVKSFGDGNIREMAQNNIRQTIYASPEYGEHIILAKGENSISIGEPGREGTEVVMRAWGIPRHPAQLYESITCLLLFFLLAFVYSRYKAATPEGMLFGIFMIWIFTLRFFYEFIKEDQVAFENSMQFNMGQLLSIPMVLIGIIVLVRSLVKKKKNTVQ